MRCILSLPFLLLACTRDPAPTPAAGPTGAAAAANPTAGPPTPAPQASAPKPDAAPTTATAPGTAPASTAPASTAPAAKPPADKPANPEGQRPALGFMPEYDSAVDGVVVGTPREGGPAAKAGITEGDIIVMLNGQRVTDARSYAEVLDEQVIGAVVPVRLKRGQQELELKVEVGSRPSR